jgi:hypothetical protein
MGWKPGMEFLRRPLTSCFLGLPHRFLLACPLSSAAGLEPAILLSYYIAILQPCYFATLLTCFLAISP